MRQIEFKDESETFVIRRSGKLQWAVSSDGGNRGDQIQYYPELGRRQ